MGEAATAAQAAANRATACGWPALRRAEEPRGGMGIGTPTGRGGPRRSPRQQAPLRGGVPASVINASPRLFSSPLAAPP